MFCYLNSKKERHAFFSFISFILPFKKHNIIKCIIINIRTALAGFLCCLLRQLVTSWNGSRPRRWAPPWVGQSAGVWSKLQAVGRVMESPRRPVALRCGSRFWASGTQGTPGRRRLGPRPLTYTFKINGLALVTARLALLGGGSVRVVMWTSAVYATKGVYSCCGGPGDLFVGAV